MLILGLLLWVVGAVVLGLVLGPLMRGVRRRRFVTVIPNEETLFPAEKRLVSEVELYLIKAAEKR